MISASGAYSWKYKPAKRGAYRMRATIAKTAAPAGNGRFADQSGSAIRRLSTKSSSAPPAVRDAGRMGALPTPLTPTTIMFLGSLQGYA